MIIAAFVILEMEINRLPAHGNPPIIAFRTNPFAKELGYVLDIKQGGSRRTTTFSYQPSLDLTSNGKVWKLDLSVLFPPLHPS
jgi:hypothetical protein